MKLAALNDWLTLIANIGVLAGLIFVGLEIRQNTLALEREISISSAESTHGVVANSDYLAQINQKMTEVNGAIGPVVALQELYGLSEEEAHRWWRYLFQVWLRNQADWIYGGKEDDACVRAVQLMRWRDNQVFFETMKFSLDQDYVACVEAATMEEFNDA
jgi:hypothetical protein